MSTPSTPNLPNLSGSTTPLSSSKKFLTEANKTQLTLERRIQYLKTQLSQTKAQNNHFDNEYQNSLKTSDSNKQTKDMLEQARQKKEADKAKRQKNADELKRLIEQNLSQTRSSLSSSKKNIYIEGREEYLTLLERKQKDHQEHLNKKRERHDQTKQAEANAGESVRQSERLKQEKLSQSRLETSQDYGGTGRLFLSKAEKLQKEEEELQKQIQEIQQNTKEIQSKLKNKSRPASRSSSAQIK